MKKKNPYILGKIAIIIPIIFFIFDRIFKVLALNGMKTSNVLFDIHLVTNTGISWGLLKGNSLALLFLSIAILGAIIYYYNTLAEAKIGTNLIIVGAISNIVDRIFLGHIIDYIDLRFFPVFNIADACITVGAIYIILHFLIKEKNSVQEIKKKKVIKNKIISKKTK